MKIEWSAEKNEKLKKERNISFEELEEDIENGKIIDVVQNKNYEHQMNLIINHNGYCYVVPTVKTEEGLFLKTAYKSRATTKKYLGGE